MVLSEEPPSVPGRLLIGNTYLGNDRLRYGQRRFRNAIVNGPRRDRRRRGEGTWVPAISAEYVPLLEQGTAAAGHHLGHLFLPRYGPAAEPAW